GIVGPVTNNIGNEAKIQIAYQNMEEMQVEAAKYTLSHIGKLQPIQTVAFFCVMFPRKVYEDVGPLDEAFGRGFFEDDDYCRRIEQLGLTIACAEDVFIHHHLSASFNKLKSADRQALFDQNKATYEAKWGTWTPHAYKNDETNS
ncbi:MAG: glycosyl transferase family 2, partial [Hafnia sp.]